MYFFYLTNESPNDLTTNEAVYGSNARCDQENILAQLNQCRALHAPVDTQIGLTVLGHNLRILAKLQEKKKREATDASAHKIAA